MPTGTISEPHSQASRVDRIRDERKLAARAERLAQQLETVCVEAEAELQASVAARHDQQLAWLVLCDRGWPKEQPVAGFDITLVHEWLATFGEMVALPVRILSPRDMVRLRRIRRRLERCELSLRPSLPSAVWQLIDPLDDTGRSTLSCLLQALVAWVGATERCDAVTRQKERITVWLSLFTHQARTLGLWVPVAPLDLVGWREVAVAARSMAAFMQKVPAA